MSVEGLKIDLGMPLGDKVLRVLEGVGEVGLDPEASPGNGKYYVKTWDGGFDIVGYSTLEEAWEVLCSLGDEE